MDSSGTETTPLLSGHDGLFRQVIACSMADRLMLGSDMASRRGQRRFTSRVTISELPEVRTNPCILLDV